MQTRLTQTLQTIFSAARILFVVTGMLSIVLLMGATAKPAVVRVNANLHGLQLAQQPFDSASEIELLRDLPDTSDSAVRQEEPAPKQMLMEVTAYCACHKCCGPNAAGVTASGRDTSYNNSQFVAADPSLPFGTKVVIPGYSDAPVEVIDRGSAIRGDKIDVFFASHEEAIQWGRQTLQVTILPQ